MSTHDDIGAARRKLFGRRPQDPEATFYSLAPGRRVPLPPVQPPEVAAEDDAPEGMAKCPNCGAFSAHASKHGGPCLICYAKMKGKKP